MFKEMINTLLQKSFPLIEIQEKLISVFGYRIIEPRKAFNILEKNKYNNLIRFHYWGANVTSNWYRKNSLKIIK